MYLKHLHLQSFRNFTDQSFDFGEKFNVLVGDNAQGKTNVLEAISFLAHTRSFRTTEWRDLIEHGRGRARVSAKLLKPEGEDELAICLEEPRKKFLRNGKNTTPTAFMKLKAVLFAPEEILLLRTSPSARRRFIDTLISSLVSTHRKTVRDYESVVSHRNRILSNEMMSRAEKERNLQPWDEQLIVVGTKIVMERQKWSLKINGTLPEHYATIAKRDEEAALQYEPQIGLEAVLQGTQKASEAMGEMLDARRKDEFLRGTTLVGPHRDDIVAYIGRGAVKRFASQGQHRTFVLALKIAEMDVVQDTVGEVPVFLLDDVASELDGERNRSFFNYLNDAKGQVFITTTSMQDVKLKDGKGIKKYTVKGGVAGANSL